jgi:uncharacterized lipoprotein YddW (UPF0748 family)/uncharacterized protein YjdB
MRLRLAAGSLLLALAACRGDLSTTLRTPEGAREKHDITASKSDVVLLLRTPSAAPGERGGQTVDLDASVTNPQGHLLPNKKHVEWRSTNESIATVDSAGFITALDTGKVLIVVDEKTVADTVEVSIVPVPVESVEVSGPDSISVRDTVTYTAAALDSVGEPLLGREVTWHSTDGSVLESLDTGGATALQTGTAQLEATVDEVVGRASVKVWPAVVATVDVVPGSVTLSLYKKVKLTATVKDRHGFVLTDRPVTWSAADPSVLALALDTVRTLAPGESDVFAEVEGHRGTAHVAVTNPVEARALWVTRFEFTNTAGTAVDFPKIATIFQKAASANFNVVYFQVRAAGDAFYFSELEPCSPRMCGRLGGPRPMQDPLVVALAEAAKYGIEVHAWLNSYTGSISGSAFICTNHFINSTPPNWLKAHLEWSVSTKNFTTGVLTRQVDNCTTTAEYMWVSPGIPEVRAQLATVAADIATRYGPLGLKGIHLDRIRYPANNVSYDQPSQDAFRAASPTNSFPTSNAQPAWLDFRRAFVNQGVKEVHDAVIAVNPAMVISAAVFPGYKPRAGWSANWSFTDLFQDPQQWAQAGSLDIEVPMNYPATAASASWTVKAYCSNTDWTCVMDDHIERIEGQSGRQVYVGVGAIRGWTEMKAQIDLAHDRGITGMSVYSFSLVDAIPNAWAQLAAGPFKYKATIPAMPWK